MRSKLGIGFGLIVGLGLGLGLSRHQSAGCSPMRNDRHEDYVLCTGPVSVQPEAAKTDGVWLLAIRN